MHNFILNGCDTDSIMFSKPNSKEFSSEEQESLLEELNSLFPEKIKWDHDGYYKSVIYLKAKNYIMYDGVKKKVKGSSLKSSTLEAGYKEFIDEIVTAILEDKKCYEEIYNKYVKRVCSITTIEEMKKFSSKKSLSNTTYSSERANETKILDAIKDTEYVVGDRVWLFFKQDNTLSLAENFNGDYNKEKLLEKLHKVSGRFSAVLDTTTWLNYKLKRNKEKLNANL